MSSLVQHLTQVGKKARLVYVRFLYIVSLFSILYFPKTIRCAHSLLIFRFESSLLLTGVPWEVLHPHSSHSHHMLKCHVTSGRSPSVSVATSKVNKWLLV